MPVPDFQTFMLPLLRLLSDGPRSVTDCLPSLRKQFNISDEEAAQLIPSKRLTVLASRAHWARTHMGKAGLLSSPKRGLHTVTPAGLKLLATNPNRIDLRTLERFDAYKAWRDQTSDDLPKAEGASPSLVPDATPARPLLSQTPEEAMKSAHDLLDSTLRDDLLAQLADLHPIRFERLILDLLSAMGFGGGDLSRTQMTKVSGDGGIDGIIHEDALGLDRVYIQAKRYAPGNNVGSPAIYQFVGSLTAQGAAKGVFVTTSDFSKDARGVAAGITHHRIVLIDGQDLARLMIRYGVGVRPRTTFVVHGIDEDYFKPADT